MNLVTLNNILKDYGICPDCDNDKVGNGEGKLIVEDDYFERSCRCGFGVVLMPEEIEVYK